MITRVRTHGSIYSVLISGRSGGAAVPFDETWTSAMRVTAGEIGGTVVADIELALVDGKFSAEIDTSAAPWEPGTFYYDVRVTPPGTGPIWSEPVKLILTKKNSPAV